MKTGCVSVVTFQPGDKVMKVEKCLGTLSISVPNTLFIHSIYIPCFKLKK